MSPPNAAEAQSAPPSLFPDGGADPLLRSQHGQIGRPVSRLDGPLKVVGGARFAAEVTLPGMLYAALAYSSIAKGRIDELDTAAAEAVPGVALVMTHRNAPRLSPPPPMLASEKGATGDSLPVMQDERIYWNGQPIAVVVAATQEAAEQAAALVRATYAAEPATTSFAAAKANGSETGTFMGMPLHDVIGDADAAFAAAPHKVDLVFRTPRHNHNAIEPHAVTVAWDGDTLMVHDASQAVAHTAWSLAQIFHLDEDAVRVSSPFVGGGFGGKCLWQHQILAAAAARLAGRPVRLALSREGVYRLIGGRTVTEQRVALGAERDGTLAAIIHTGTVAKTRANMLPEPFIFGTRGAYAAKTVKLDVETVFMDMLSNTFMRAPGEAPGTFALECAIDELAEHLGIDPIALRLKNEPDKDPISGLPFSGRHIDEAWRLGAQRFGWDRRNPLPGGTRDGEWLIGLGCAAGTYPYYRMPGGAARITLDRDGRATVDIAAHEMGMGTATAQTQVAADRLGLPMEAVAFNYGDSTLPGLVLAGGSQQTASIGAAVYAAWQALAKELLTLAGNDSPLAGLAAEALVGRDAGLGTADGAAHETYASILGRANRDSVSVTAEAVPPAEMGQWSMHSHSAVFCEARVNAVTGEPRVTRLLGAFDCGRILNAKMAASQFRGGMIMGLGMALMEETLFDERTGRIMNPSLAEYHVPVHMDVPEIEVVTTDIPDPHTPMGARGVGEIGITGTAAAIANAIHNATGRRIRELPITLDKLM